MAHDPSLKLASDIPVGDLQLFDDYVPALAAGNWRIDATHTLLQGSTPVNDTPFSAAQEFVVSAPQVAIDPGLVVQRYPPPSSTAHYGEILPHIVLSDTMLPWERGMGEETGGPRAPWIALLCLSEEEIVGGESNPTRAQASTVAAFMAADPTVLKPAIVREDDVAPSDPCAFITLSTAVFQAVAPRLSELPWLAHCRQANTGDKAIAGLNEHGLSSVIVANRFPAMPAARSTTPRTAYVHLVSLEGWGPQLVPNPDFSDHTQLALLSLASWSFQVQAEAAEDFRGLATNLVASEASGADSLWLRLPPPPITAEDAASQEAKARLDQGYVALPFHLRSGEDSFAWYRGPLTPLLPAPLVKARPFATPDAALIYDTTFGVFDTTLAAAWEAGRAAALSDRVFAQQLLDFRRRAHGITDRLLDRLTSDHFSASDIAAVDPDALVQHAFLDALAAGVTAATSAGTGPSSPAAPASAPPPATAKADIKAFLADPQMLATVAGLVADDLAVVAQWLAKLLLLAPVPFAYLVPDARMLPVEGLRFFYVDANWTAALIDGAVSVGVESSRTSFFQDMTHGLVEEAAQAAAAAARADLQGVEPPADQSARGLMSGFLLRSALVSGWPTLAVRPCMADGTLLKILRIEHLSPSVLLCIVWGVPDHIDLAEPQEGFRFGVDDGLVALRTPTAATTKTDPPLGQQIIGATVAVVDPSGAAALCMRGAGSRVLNLVPSDPASLVATLHARVATASGHLLETFGPGDFALQMVKAPDAVRFTSSASAKQGERL